MICKVPKTSRKSYRGINELLVNIHGAIQDAIILLLTTISKEQFPQLKKGFRGQPTIASRLVLHSKALNLRVNSTPLPNIELVRDLVETHAHLIKAVENVLHVEDMRKEDLQHIIELLLRLWQVTSRQKLNKIGKVIVSMK